MICSTPGKRRCVLWSMNMSRTTAGQGWDQHLALELPWLIQVLSLWQAWKHQVIIALYSTTSKVLHQQHFGFYFFSEFNTCFEYHSTKYILTVYVRCNNFSWRKQWKRHILHNIFKKKKIKCPSKKLFSKLTFYNL